MTLFYDSYFDYIIDSDDCDNFRWFEHSNIGFRGEEDERPMFNQYEDVIESSSWAGPKFRLIPEIHNLLDRSFSHYRIKQIVDPETFHPYIRCEATNIEDSALILMKLTWNIVVHRYDIPSL